MSISQTKKIMFRKFAREGIYRLEDIMINSFDIQTIPVSYQVVSNLMRSRLDLTFPLRDEKHYLTNWGTWEELIEYDWTEKRKYISDKRDCDDYAEKFCANMTWLYGLNSCFPISVQLLDPKDDTHISYHRAVLIADDTKSLYMYDPMEGMKDGYQKIEDGEDIIIKNWKYRPRLIRY